MINLILKVRYWKSTQVYMFIGKMDNYSHIILPTLYTIDNYLKHNRGYCQEHGDSSQDSNIFWFWQRVLSQFFIEFVWCCFINFALIYVLFYPPQPSQNHKNLKVHKNKKNQYAYRHKNLIININYIKPTQSIHTLEKIYEPKYTKGVYLAENNWPNLM